jgi:hypothetical protein
VQIHGVYNFQNEIVTSAGILLLNSNRKREMSYFLSHIRRFLLIILKIPVLTFTVQISCYFDTKLPSFLLVTRHIQLFRGNRLIDIIII